MSLEATYRCPHCGSEQTFYRTASTTVPPGETTKWACAECDYSFAKIGEVTTLHA